MGVVFLAIAVFQTVFVVIESNHVERWPDIDFDVRDSVLWTAIVASLACLGLVAALAFRRSAGKLLRWRTAGKLALSLAIFGSGSLYFGGVHGLANPVWPHLYDAYHYLGGPKYYRELSYTDLYRCTIQAEPGLFRDSSKVRDLATGERVALPDYDLGPSCAESLGPERWQEFRHDLRVFTQGRTYEALLPSAVRDNGYNGTPSLSALGYAVANAAPLERESLHVFTLIDVWAVCAALFVITRAFGWRLGCVFALAVFTCPIDRQLIIGGSFLRYAWFVALLFGIAALRRERYWRAGAWLAAATMLNLHPAVFILGVLLKMTQSLVRTRRLQRKYIDFCLAGVLTASALGVVGMMPRGRQAWVEFKNDMVVHDATGRFPRNGVGFKWVFLRGDEKTKHAQLSAQKPIYSAAAIVLLLIAAAVSTRLDDTEAAILMGFAALFCFLPTTGYYFLSASMLVLLWYKRLWSAGPGTMVVAHLAGYAVILWGHYASDDLSFAFNVLTSHVWAGYLLATLTYLAVDTGLARRVTSRFSPGRS
jgi:hypothetical protein